MLFIACKVHISWEQGKLSYHHLLLTWCNTAHKVLLNVETRIPFGIISVSIADEYLSQLWKQVMWRYSVPSSFIANCAVLIPLMLCKFFSNYDTHPTFGIIWKFMGAFTPATINSSDCWDSPVFSLATASFIKSSKRAHHNRLIYFSIDRNDFLVGEGTPRTAIDSVSSVWPSHVAICPYIASRSHSQ